MLARWLDTAAETSSDHIALITADRSLNYAELAALAQHSAHLLVAQGVSPGDTIALAVRSPLLLATMAWAVSYLGGTLLPLNPSASMARFSALLEQAGVDWIMTDDDIALPERKLRTQDLRWWEHTACGTLHSFTAREGNDVALIITTSGSEGDPKGVMLSQANMQSAVLASRSRIPLQAGDMWVACLPLYHIGGLSILYRCAEAGATLLLHAQNFDARQVLQDLTRHPVTHVSLVPAMLAQLLDGGPVPPKLKYALIGGAPLSDSLAQRASQQGWPICPSYGLSEAASQAATLCSLPDGWVQGMAGQPLPGMELQIVDMAGQSCKGPGRIRLRGSMVMQGYVNASGRGGEGLQDGWFTTGDSGYLDAQGNLVVLGRHDDVLVTGGEKVHPAEVEARMLACPGLRDVAVTAIPDTVWGDRLVALIVGDAAPELVNDWCQAHLPNYQRPRLIVPLSDLPRNALGKLQRGRLRQLACATIGDKCYSAFD